MVIVKIHNDYKEKHQSFEAWIDGIDCERGYGSSKEEAIDNYNRILETLILRLQVASNAIALRSFDTSEVNWSGCTIDENF